MLTVTRLCRRWCGQEAVGLGKQIRPIGCVLYWRFSDTSRYKNHRVDGKVTALWAGSALTYKEMIDHIRPEDFEIRYRSKKNRFRFLGNGRSKLEYEPNADLAFYIYK